MKVRKWFSVAIAAVAMIALVGCGPSGSGEDIPAQPFDPGATAPVNAVFSMAHNSLIQGL